MNRSFLACCTVAALTLLVGHIYDRTTGQPLAGVTVSVQQGHSTLHGHTGRDGRFAIAGLRPGPHVLQYSSSDVPPAQFALTVKGKRAQVTITACSTTLDYSCEGGGGS